MQCKYSRIARKSIVDTDVPKLPTLSAVRYYIKTIGMSSRRAQLFKH